MTLEKPKCLIEVGGKSFLERMVENLMGNGIERIKIIVGYRFEKIEELLREKEDWGGIELIKNERYREWNNGYSLWLGLGGGLEEVSGGYLFLDSDILFEKRIIGGLLGSGFKNGIVVRKSQDLGMEEMKVRARDGKVIELSKELGVKDVVGESIGIHKISEDFARELKKKLEARLRSGGGGDFYEASINEVIRGGEVLKIYGVEEESCGEVDTLEDLEYIKNKIFKSELF